MALGQNILKLRKKKGLSQEELGEKIDVTRQTISNWELEETSPNPDQLKLLSNVLEVSIDDLMDNTINSAVLNKLKLNDEQTKKVKKVLKGVVIGLIVLLAADIITFAVCYTKKIGPFKEKKSETNIVYVKDSI
ncbi:MAG: helix-turn-helix domain-containing protein [Bacilli bacterium]|nr:helix-turn-helix domain-containing protein [Bacilli bacterium]